jgi:hypothetical protein
MAAFRDRLFGPDDYWVMLQPFSFSFFAWKDSVFIRGSFIGAFGERALHWFSKL